MRGIDTTVFELETGGIPKLLEKHGLAWEELGLQGCTLFYRRRAEDMPLVEAPEGADAARLAKVEAGRRKVLEKAMEKYLFRVETLAAPDGLVVENDRLVGLRFRRMKVDTTRSGKLLPTGETFERRGSTVVSSIGSIPDPIPGLPTKGELLAFDDWDLGRIAAYPTLFGAGNVVTGKGNIVASRKHATRLAGDRGNSKPSETCKPRHAGEERLASAAAAARRTPTAWPPAQALRLRHRHAGEAPRPRTRAAGRGGLHGQRGRLDTRAHAARSRIKEERAAFPRLAWPPRGRPRRLQHDA
jgi:hypothetical protein